MLRRRAVKVAQLVANAATCSASSSLPTSGQAFSSASSRVAAEAGGIADTLRQGVRGALLRRATGGHSAFRSAAPQSGGSSTGSPTWQQLRHQWNDRLGYQHFDRRGGFMVMHPHHGAGQRSIKWLVLLGAGGTVVWVSSRQPVPYTDRMHSILISPQDEQEMGKEAFKQILTEARASHTLLPPDHPASRAVRRVGMRIAHAATDGYGGGFQGHLKDLQWEFAVVRSDQVNAFVVPGGKVVVYTGLLKLIRNEDELASVLAHEVAHVVARHAAERLTQVGVVELARLVAYWGFGLPIPAGPLSAVFFLPNSRKQETEADVIGVQVCTGNAVDSVAGMSINMHPTGVQKLGAAEAKEGGNMIPKFLRTHPASEDRLAALERMMPLAEGLYETSGCEAVRGPLFQFKQILRRVDW